MEILKKWAPPRQVTFKCPPPPGSSSFTDLARVERCRHSTNLSSFERREWGLCNQKCGDHHRQITFTYLRVTLMQWKRLPIWKLDEENNSVIIASKHQTAVIIVRSLIFENLYVPQRSWVWLENGHGSFHLEGYIPPQQSLILLRHWSCNC